VATKRKVEVFSAGCAACQEAVEIERALTVGDAGCSPWAAIEGFQPTGRAHEANPSRGRVPDTVGARSGRRREVPCHQRRIICSSSMYAESGT